MGTGIGFGPGFGPYRLPLAPRHEEEIGQVSAQERHDHAQLLPLLQLEVDLVQQVSRVRARVRARVRQAEAVDLVAHAGGDPVRDVVRGGGGGGAERGAGRAAARLAQEERDERLELADRAVPHGRAWLGLGLGLG